MKSIWIIVVFLLGAFLATGNAMAHRVNVFAWAEGDTVHVESKFSGGKKIAGAKIIVTDAGGVEVLTGQTDDQGQFSFKRPQPAELKIILEAGMGHRAQWTLPVDDGHADHPADKSRPEKANPRGSLENPDGQIYHRNSETPTAVYAGPSRAEIEAIVEKALDKKMKPVLEMLAESRHTEPGIGDILGGIGYIIGLVGTAAYFHSRKKKI
jgi:nickel transport protein